MTLQILLIITAAIRISAFVGTDYCKLCGDHTLCKYADPTPSARCLEYEFHPVTESEKQAIVHHHNELRSKVAMGKELRGISGPQPSSSNMMEMSWDDELAHIAQRWANQCQGEDHDTCRDVKRFHVGQNMAQEGDMELKFEPNHFDLINMWYDEVVYVNSTLVDSYTGKKANKNNQVGHYTQMVWAVTYLIGCGRAVYKENVDGDIFLMEHFVCNYGPAGNVLTMPVYKRGPPASECPTGLVSPNYSGLCLSISAAHMNTSISMRPPPPPLPPPPPPPPAPYAPSFGGQHKWSTPQPLNNWRTSQYPRYPAMNYSPSPSPQHNNWLTTPSTPVGRSRTNNMRNQSATEGNDQRIFPHSSSQSASENPYQMTNSSSPNGHKKYDSPRSHAKEDQLTVIIDQQPGEQQTLKFLKLIVGPNAMARSASERKMIKVSNNVAIIVEPSEERDQASSNTQCFGDCMPNKSSHPLQKQNDETLHYNDYKMFDSFDSNSQSNIPPYPPQNYNQKENTGKYKAAYPGFFEKTYPLRRQHTDDQMEQHFPLSVYYQQLPHPKEGNYGMEYSVS